MKKKQLTNEGLHPVMAHAEEIERNGVLVIDNVTSVPGKNEIFATPNLIVVICHEGSAGNLYDSMRVLMGPHDISVIYPKHSLQNCDKTPDYLATLICVSPRVLEEVRYLSPRHYQLEYMKLPGCHLDAQHYETVLDCLKVLRAVCQTQGANREPLMAKMLDVMSLLLDNYRFRDSDAQADPTGSKELFYQFYDDLVHHYRESHEVNFYAQRCGLTPKYFASVIKGETGVTASTWISRYLATQAKTLLRNPALEVKEVCDTLGFPCQSSFGRFFKHVTGMSPSDFRRLRE